MTVNGILTFHIRLIWYYKDRAGKKDAMNTAQM